MAVPLKLIFGVHLHQPVGNFLSVLEESYQKAYRPFIEEYASFPELKLVWHSSGFLLEWLQEKHPEYIGLLQEMLAGGRLEIFTGGMYEPIFPVIPRSDRNEQIRRLSRRVEEIFGSRPRGIWLAERVWEPAMAGDLHEAGIQYVALDDNHFLSAGHSPAELDGYFVAEDLDRPVGAFPISERMRYLIPWAEVKTVREELENLNRKGQRLAVMMDDGEKFGAWPGTHEWVYGRKWLREFLQMLVNQQDMVQTGTFGEYFDAYPAAGKAALPATSYMEMGEWALPPESASAFVNCRLQLEKAGWLEQFKPFLRGGIWRNFLNRYPEGNYLHKRMLQLSRCFTTDAARQSSAYDHLLMAQSNDPYWHGVFGGIYFPHLRLAAWQNLLIAQGGLEEMAGRPLWQTEEESCRDLDLDGQPEVILNNRRSMIVISPHQGGALLEFSSKDFRYNFLAGLARWREKYHLGGSSIKAIPVAENSKMAEGAAPVFDLSPRVSCRERLFSYLPEPGDLLRLEEVSEWSYWGKTFRRETVGAGGGVRLVNGDGPGRLEKTYELSDREELLEIDYQLGLDGGLACWLEVEWTLGIPGGEDPEKCLYLPDQPQQAAGISTLTRRDRISALTVDNRRDGFTLTFSGSEPFSVRTWPIETVCLALDTMEKTFQGFSLAFFFPVRQGENHFKLTVKAGPSGRIA